MATPDPLTRLDTLFGLAEVCARNGKCFESLGHPFDRIGDTNRSFEDGGLRCGLCGGVRRMRVHVHWTPTRDGDRAIRSLILTDLKTYQDDPGAYWVGIAEQMTPSLLVAECLQNCGATFTIALHSGPNGPNVAVLPNHHGALATRHTPAGVAYYLDQAHRAIAVGANSAAIAMFRSALEQLLHEQGIEGRMVGHRLQVLETMIADGTAPSWALSLPQQFLGPINRLGAGSVHTNDGDIGLQVEMDTDLVGLVVESFEELLEAVYERENATNQRLAALSEKAARFDRRYREAPRVPDES